MKISGWIGFILGCGLVVLGIVIIAYHGTPAGIIPSLIGVGLIFLNLKEGRTGLIIFGHLCIVLGCFLITWGVYLLPYVKPTLLHIFVRPLFWGLFSVFGGLCANFHGFCACVRKQK